jgi:hypothetical protein
MYESIYVSKSAWRKDRGRSLGGIQHLFLGLIVLFVVSETSPERGLARMTDFLQKLL